MTIRYGILKKMIPAFIAMVGISACEQRAAVYEYRSVSPDGWEPCDTFLFPIDSLAQGDTYQLALQLRTSTTTPFPYQTLWLEVTQQWESPLLSRVDTVACRLATDEGYPCGVGVSLYQYEFPFDTLTLQQGARGYIGLRHIMRSKLLPGVSEVGLCLEPQALP